MYTLEPEHKKYFNKFGAAHQSSMDCRQEARRPMARCTVCVERFGDSYRHDNLTLELVRGVMKLCCPSHRRKRYAK